MYNNNFSEVERYVKRLLKKKMSVTQALLVFFMITGLFGMSVPVFADWISIDDGKVGSSNKSGHKTGVVALNPISGGAPNASKVGDYSVAIGSSAKAEGKDSVSIGKRADANKPESVSIGSESSTDVFQSVAIGFQSTTQLIDKQWMSEAERKEIENDNSQGQATAVGVKATAVAQATAVGNDVYARGRSSIAIGSDDVATYKNEITDHDAQNYFKKLYKSIDPQGIKYGFKEDGGKLHALTENINGNIQKKSNIRYSPTLADGHGAIAIGTRSIAYDNGATALGTLAFAFGKESTAVGTMARAEGERSIALGNNTVIFSNNSVAAGNENQVLKKGGMAYGYKAYSGGEGSIAIGTEVYSNVDIDYNKKFKNGTLSTSNEIYVHDGDTLENKHNSVYRFDLNGVANSAGENKFLNSGNYFSNANSSDNSKGYIDKLEQALTKEENGKKYSLWANTEEYHNIKNIVKTKGKNSIVIGSLSAANGDNSLALGRGAFGRANNAFAIGSYSYALKENAMAFGVASRALAKNSLAFGVGAGVNENSNNSVAIGQGAVVRKGSNALALGSQVRIDADSGMGVGNNTYVNLENSIAIGNESKTDYKKEDLEKVGYAPKGVLSVPSTAKVGILSVGSSGAERRIANVAAGYRETDAVNVGQLRALEEKVNQSGLLDEADDMNAGAHYLAVNKDSQEVKEINKILEIQKDYNEYIQYKARKLEIDGRKKRGDALPQDYVTAVEKKVNELEQKYTENTSPYKNSELKKLSYNEQKSFEENMELIYKAKKTDTYKNGQDGEKKTIFDDDTNSDLMAKKQKLEESNFNNTGAKGENSIALGFKAKTDKTTGEGSVAIGTKANVSGEKAIAIGQEASVSIENGSTQTATQGIAIGNKARVYGGQGIAIGTGDARANGQDVANNSETKAATQAIAIGTGALATGNYSTAIGGNVSSIGTASIAIGDRAKSIMEGALAIGQNSQAQAKYGIALGYGATSSSGKESSIAIGKDAKAKHSGSVAIGMGSEANSSTGMGYLTNSQHTEGRTFAVGSTSVKRRITGVADGSSDSDAVTVAQLKRVTGGVGNIKFAGDKPNENEQTFDLTKKIEIKGSSAQKANNAGAETWDQNDNQHTVENIQTYVSKNGDTQRILIGMKNNPRFGKVKLGSTGEIELGVSDGKLNLNNKKISGLANATENNEAVNYSQLKSLESKIKKINIDADNTTLNESNALSLGDTFAIRGTKNGTPSQDGSIPKVEEGWNVGNANNQVRYVTDNIQTYAKVEDGKKVVLIGMKERPKFKEITSEEKIILGNDNTIELTKDTDHSLKLNSKKFTGLADGDVSNSSTDAVTGKQLNDYVKEVAGNSENANEQLITFTKSNATNGGQKYTANLNTTNLINKLSEGANIGSPNANSPKLVKDSDVKNYLDGKQISVLGDNNSTSNSGQPKLSLSGTVKILGREGKNANGAAEEWDSKNDNHRMTVENIETFTKQDETGNVKILVGMKKSPKFNTVKLGANGEVELGVSDNALNLGEGLTNGTRKIVNVSDGVNDKDAANYGQVKKATEKVEAETVTGNEKALIEVTSADGTGGLGKTYTVKATDELKNKLKEIDKKVSQDDLNSYAKKDGTNLTNLTEANKQAWATGIGTNSISDTANDNNSKLVTEKAVKDYVAGKKITFKSDFGNIQKGLGETIDLIGGETNNKDWKYKPDQSKKPEIDYSSKNVMTKVEDGKILIGLKKNVEFDSVTFGANGPKLSKSDDGHFSVNSKKITSLAEGTISSSSTDAITGKQLDGFVKELAGDNDITVSDKTSVSGGGQKYTLSLNDTLKTKINSIDNKADKSAMKFTYKTSTPKTQNGNADKELDLASTDNTDKVLDFKSGSNLTTEVKKGSIEYALKSDLTGIASVSGGGNNNKSKVSLEENGLKLSHDNATLTLTKDGTDKVKLSGLNETEITDNNFGTDGIAATQKQVKAAKEAATETVEANGTEIEVTPENSKTGKGKTFKVGLSQDTKTKLDSIANKADSSELTKYAKVDGSNVNGLDEGKKMAWANGIGKTTITDNPQNILVTEMAVKNYVDNKQLTLGADNHTGHAVKLGETFDISGRKNDGTNNPDGWDVTGTTSKNGRYVTDNVETFVSRDTNSNKTRVLVGIKETPTFKDLTIKDGSNSVKFTATSEALTLDSKKISGVKDGVAETDAVNMSQLASAKENVTGTQNYINVTTSGGNGKTPKTFTVDLDNSVKTKLNDIGTGEVSGDHANKDKTVTGKKVYDAIQDAKKGSTETVEQGEGITVTSADGQNGAGKTYTVALSNDYKTKINGALSKTEAEKTYAKVGLDNINAAGKVVIKNLINVSQKTADTGDENILNIETENQNGENAKNYKLSVNKSKVKSIAQESIEVKEATPANGITVTKEDKDGKHTYKLSLDEQKIKQLAGTTTIDETYAKKDGSNLTKLDDAHKKAWADGIGTTTISNTDAMANNGSDNHLVTAGAVKSFVNGKKLMLEADNNTGKDIMLGETFEITGRKIDGTRDFDTWSVTNSNTKKGIYSTENVETFVDRQGTKTSVLVGIKENPKFKSINIDDKSSVAQGTTSLDLTYDGAKLSITKDNDKVKLSGLKDDLKTGETKLSDSYGTSEGVAATQKEVKALQTDLEAKITANKGSIEEAEAKDTESPIVVETEITAKGNKFKFDLDKTKAVNKLSKDANITNANNNSPNLVTDVQVKTALETAKETVVGDNYIQVTPKAGTNGKGQTFTVGLNSETKNKIDLIGTGTVSSGNANTVTGGNVYTAVRGSKTTADVAKDEEILEVTKTESSNINANKYVFNINKDKITELVDVKAGTNDVLTVTSEVDNNTKKKTFTVDLKNDVKNKINEIDNKANTTDLAAYAKKDGSNLTDITPEQKTKWAAGIGESSIDTSNDADTKNTKLVTGKAVTDYVKKQGLKFTTDNSANNLVNLGETLGIFGKENNTNSKTWDVGTAADKTHSTENVSTFYENKKIFVGIKERPKFKEIKSEEKITLGNDGNAIELTKDTDHSLKLNSKKITGLADGTIGTGSTDAVTGGQVHTKLEAKADANADNISGENLNKWKQKLGVTQVGTTEVVQLKEENKGLTLTEVANGNGKTYTIGIDKDKLITNLSEGANIANGTNATTSNLVTDKQVKTYLDGQKKDIEAGAGSMISVTNGQGKVLGNENVTLDLTADTKTKINNIGGGEVVNTGDNKDKTVTGEKVFNAITGAKTKVKAGDTEDIVEVNPKNGTDGLAANEYTLTINKENITKLIDVKAKENGSGMLEVSDATDNGTKKKTFTIDINEETKNKINNAVSKDASNLDNNGETTNRDKWIEKLGTNDEIKSGNDLANINNGKGRLITEQAFNNYMNNNKLKFGANSGEEVSIALGGKLEIKAEDITENTSDYKAKNIHVKSDKNSNKLSIGIKDNPEFKDITLGENGNTVNLTTNKDGLNLNSKKLTGLNDATDDTDAVNYKQFKELQNTVNTAKINLSADNNNNYDLALGEKLEFLTNKTGAAGTTPKTFNIGSGQDQVTYSTKNLATQIEQVNDGAAVNGVQKTKKQIFVGISENPEFNTVKVGTEANTVTLSSTATGLSLGSKKLENLADGIISSTSTDAITGKQVDGFVKELTPSGDTDADKLITIEKDTTYNNGGQKYKLGINEANLINKLSTGANISSPVNNSPKLVTDKQVKAHTDALTLKYKANSDTNDANHKTVKLSDGLDFTAGSNLTASVEDGGKVKYDLKSSLTGINSISGGKENGDNQPDKSKIELTKDGVKLTNDGASATITKDGDKVKISGLKEADTTNANYGKNGNGGTAATQKEVRDVLDKLGATGDSSTKTIVERIREIETGTAGNIIYTDEQGNKLIKDKTDGKFYKLGNDGNADKTKEVTTDKVVLSAVNPNANAGNGEKDTTKPITLGNIASALGITQNIKNGGADNSTEYIKDAQGKVKELLSKESGLDKAVTLKDLQAIAKTGLTFKANKDSDEVRVPLGNSLTIKGDLDDFTKNQYNKKNGSQKTFDSAQNNIFVEKDKDGSGLTLKLAKHLENLDGINLHKKNGGGHDDNITLLTDGKGKLQLKVKEKKENGMKEEVTKNVATEDQLKLKYSDGKTLTNGSNEIDLLKDTLTIQSKDKYLDVTAKKGTFDINVHTTDSIDYEHHSGNGDESAEAKAKNDSLTTEKAVVDYVTAKTDALELNVVDNADSEKKVNLKTGKLKFANGSNTTATVSKTNGTTEVKYDINDDITLGKEDANGNGKDGKIKVVGKSGSSVELTDGTIKLSKKDNGTTTDATIGLKKDGSKFLDDTNNTDKKVRLTYKNTTNGANEDVELATMKDGLTFEANFGENNGSTQIKKKLNEVISITASGASNGRLTRNNGQDNYTGTNLATYVNGGKMYIGLKEDSAFKSLTIGGTDFGNTTKAGKGKIEADDNALKLTHDKATISIQKAGTENGDESKAKITGLKDYSVNDASYGQAGTAATQKEVKEVLDKTQKVQDGLSGTVIYTDENGNKLMKEGNKFYKVNTNGGNQKGEEVSNDKVILSTVSADGSTTTPIILGNVKSALGLEEEHKVADGDNSENNKKKKEKIEKLKKKIVGENGNDGFLNQKDGLNKAVNLQDLQAVARLGLYLKGNDGEAIQHALGETFNIEGKKFENGNTYSKDKYSSDNLATRNDDGTLRLEMLKAPKFDEVTVQNGDDNKTKITKDGITITKEGKVENDGMKGPSNDVKFGVDDNGRGTLEDTNNFTPSPIVTEHTVTKAQITYKTSDKNGNGKNGNAQKETTLAQGFNFQDTENITAKIEDKGVVKFELNKDLKKIESIESDGEENNKVKLTLEKDKGASFKTGTDGATTKIGKEGIDITRNGANGQTTTPDISFKVGKNGTNGNGATGPSIDFATNGTAQDGKGNGTGTINNLVDRKASDDKNNGQVNGYGTGTNVGRAATEGAVKEIYDQLNGDNGIKNKVEEIRKDIGSGKDGKDGKDGTNGSGKNGLTGKDGLNGKDLTTKVNALRDGEAGTVVFTDADGNRVVKADDGKYYKASDVDDKGKVKNNGTTPTEVTNPELRLVNSNGETTKLTTLNNVASALGLDLDTMNGKAIDKDKAIEAVQGKKGDNNKKGLLQESDKKELAKATNKADLQAVAQAGLNFKGNAGETHKTLGDTLTIKGNDKATNDNFDKDYDKDNLATKVDNEGNIILGLAKKLHNLEEVKTKLLEADTITSGNDTDGKTTINKTGVVVQGSADKDGKVTAPKTTLSKDGIVSEGKTGEDGKTTLNKDGLKVEGKDNKKEHTTTVTNKGLTIQGPETTKTVKEKEKVQENGKEVEKEVEKQVTEAGKITNITNDKDGNVVVSRDGDKTTKVTNVADGNIAAGSTDAVTGGQVYQIVDQIEKTLNQHGNAIVELNSEVKGGMANAAAMATLEFMDIGVNQATVAAAIGTYRGNQAIAVGVQMAPSENVRVHGKFSVAPGTKNHTMAGVGASWRFNLR